MKKQLSLISDSKRDTWIKPRDNASPGTNESMQEEDTEVFKSIDPQIDEDTPQLLRLTENKRLESYLSKTEIVLYKEDCPKPYIRKGILGKGSRSIIWLV